MDDAPKNTIPLMWVEMCLSPNPEIRRQGFQLLIKHPDSRGLRITCLLAFQFLMDQDPKTAKDALFTLGYGVGRQRWSWNPQDRDEHEISEFAQGLCGSLSEEALYRLLCLCDAEAFRGPTGLGERLCDVISCCFDTAETVLDRVSTDPKEPMQRRANALYLLFDCDDGELEDAKSDLLADARVKDAARWLFGIDRVPSDDPPHEDAT